jgi:N-acetylglucosamine-6-phosphate deacetylase
MLHASMEGWINPTMITKQYQIRNPKHVPRLALTNGWVILPDQVSSGLAVVIEGSKIIGVVQPGEITADTVIIDAGGRYISPGLIDIHTHGTLNHDFNEPSRDAYTIITRENARHGVTALLATLVAAPLASMVQTLGFAQQWLKKPQKGAHILGMHIESPYISLQQKGALEPDFIRSPDDGTADLFLQFGNLIKIFVLAPELPGALELVRKLNQIGIIPAAGHSSAKDEEVFSAMNAGLRHVTHIWSAMSSVVREGPWRKPGLLEAALTDERLTVEMISDNKHLPATLMKLAYRSIGPKRLCAISDATAGAGLPEGAHFYLGEKEFTITNGIGMTPDFKAFAGSSTLLNQMIPVLTGVVGIPLHEAVRMASLTPASIIGVDKEKGSISSGKDADIVIFNNDFTPWRTMIAGQWVFAEGDVQ